MAVHYRLYGAPVMANEVVEMLSLLFDIAEGWGITPKGGNPCKPVTSPRRTGVNASFPRRSSAFLGASRAKPRCVRAR